MPKSHCCKPRSQQYRWHRPEGGRQTGTGNSRQCIRSDRGRRSTRHPQAGKQECLRHGTGGYAVVPGCCQPLVVVNPGQGHLGLTVLLLVGLPSSKIEISNLPSKLGVHPAGALASGAIFSVTP